jgi:hypothetical protein
MNKSSLFLQTSQRNNQTYIFDPIRKKAVILTPEEWIRQQILQYMTEQLGYPLSLISVEKQIRIGSLRKRYDIVVYQNAQPWLIIECKNETEKLNPVVLSQLLSYVSVLPVHYLALSNGHEMFTYHVASKKWQEGLPVYNPISE